MECIDRFKTLLLGTKTSEISKLWDSMVALYGATWTNKYKPFLDEEGKELTGIGKFWCKGLGDFSLRAINLAIANLSESYPDRPPNFPQFRKLCKQFRQPGEANAFKDPKLCEFTDEQSNRCGNLGSMSPNVNGGGPWYCDHHFYGRGSHAPTDRGQKAWLDELYADFRRDHPELVPKQGDTLKSVKERNLAFINGILGGAAVLRELPYDKDRRIDGDNISREESIAKAEGWVDSGALHEDIPW